MRPVALRSRSQWSYPMLSTGAFTATLAVREAGPADAPKPRLLDRVKAALIAHLERARQQHQADLRHGAGWVELSNALTRKYPNAGRDWGWQWIFPATRMYMDRLTAQRRRHHLHESVLQRAVKDALRSTRIARQATRDTFRHSFATHPLEESRDIRTVQELLGHQDVSHHDDLHPRSQPGTRRSPEPRRPDVPVMTSAAGNIGLAAAVQVIACSASRYITARERRRALQGRANAGADGARWGSFLVLYRPTQPDSAFQVISSWAHSHQSVGVSGRKRDKVNIPVLAVVVALMFSVLATPFGAAAQQTGRVYRLGFLYGIPVPPGAAVFEQALRDLGWVKGQNIAIEYRSAEGHLDRLPALAAELVALRVNLIIANSAPETKAAREATRSIPIVFVVHGDPVGTGDVQSLARPGGNVTGLSQLHPELSAKQLDVLKQVVPRLGRIAVLWNAEVASKAGDWRELQSAGQVLGVGLQSREVRRPGDLDGAFAAIRNDRPDALLILGDPMLFTLRASIAQFAGKERLPAMYPWRGAVHAGGLISYGADADDLNRRAAWYVDRILKGAKPADLPVQQPIKFELAVNLKAAKALGVTIPPSLLLRVDHLIE